MKAVKRSVAAIYAAAAMGGLSAWGQSIPAFPGAEGPGSYATGGRGQYGAVGGPDVYHVTSLADDRNGTIPGTLRYGLNTAPAAGRTIVFDVGGVIRLVPDVNRSTGTWLKSSKGNITIAGQTAPGPGITIVGQGTKLDGNNVILRNMKFRPGQDQQRPGVLTNDGFSNYLKNSILDHVSVSWADDEGLSSTDAVTNTTVQYSIIGGGLNYTLNDGTQHAMGSLIFSEQPNAKISYHHNLYIHQRTRNPRVGPSNSDTGAVVNFSNNVIYNWTGRAGYSTDLASRTNFVGNTYIAGPNTLSSDRVFYSPNTLTQVYHGNTNAVDMNKNGVWDAVPFNYTGAQFQGTMTTAASPFDIDTGYIQSAASAVPQVVNYAGAQWWSRDYIDTRFVQDITTGTGAFINYVSDAPKSPDLTLTYDAAGFPQYPQVNRPANFDVDQDGMADSWERAHGLNPGSAADNAGDFDADGYTNLEEYFNDIAAFPSPTVILFQQATGGRFEEILNWGLPNSIPGTTGRSYTPWQPSRFDVAQINSGTVTVDSVGQNARILQVGTGATVEIRGGWLQVAEQVSIATGGSVKLLGGELRAGRLAAAFGGVFELKGGLLAANEVMFPLTVEGGFVSPGRDGIGMMGVAGDFDIVSGGLLIEIGSPSLADLLLVTGEASLGGEMLVALADGYNPAYGDAWQIIDAGSLSGSFASLPNGFELRISGGDVFLVAVPEPTTLGIFAAACMPLFRRKRR